MQGAKKAAPFGSLLLALYSAGGSCLGGGGGLLHRLGLRGGRFLLGSGYGSRGGWRRRGLHHQGELHRDDEQIPVGVDVKPAAAGLCKALGNGQPQAAALGGAVLVPPDETGRQVVGIHGDFVA